MKRLFLVFILFILAVSAVYSQRAPIVGVIQFESTGAGVTDADAARLTVQVFEELSSWGTLNVVHGSSGAEYLVRGTLSRSGANFVLSGATLNARTGQVLNEYTQQAQTVAAISVFQFCTDAVERVSLPNYLLGTWQAVVNMPDGPAVSIIQFNADRTVIIERYDTWEHKQNNSLRYEGFGGGTYTYIGFANRIVNIGSRQVRIDAIASVNLTLEEALSAHSSINRGNLQLIFNSDRTSFEIINNILPFGRNYDGPSVHPSEVVGFTQFTKIR